MVLRDPEPLHAALACSVHRRLNMLTVGALTDRDPAPSAFERDMQRRALLMDASVQQAAAQRASSVCPSEEAHLQRAG
jgi:hypothetical protein